MGKRLVPTFKIGQWVEVEAICSTYKDGNQKLGKIAYFKNPIKGVICGAVHRYIGRITPAVNDEYNFVYDWKPHKALLLWKITIGLVNTPFEALERHVKPISHRGQLPILDNQSRIYDVKLIRKIIS